MIIRLPEKGCSIPQDFVTYHKVGRLAPEYNHAYKSGTFVTDPEGNAVKISDPRPGKFGEVYMIYMKDGVIHALALLMTLHASCRE
jgi:hypothetical protein